MVAGSTMSAKRAVSVMNCSWTQTNRSSRAKPRFTRSCSGATESGLVFWMESAAAFEQPGARHGRDATRCMHVDGAVARAGKAVAEPEEGAFALADQLCKGLDGGDIAAGDARRPGRRPLAPVGGKLLR